MKTVKPVNGGVPVRVKDGEAERRVKAGDWVLCPKVEWKKQVRDAAKAEAEAKAKEKREAERIPRKIKPCSYCGHKARKRKDGFNVPIWEINHAEGCFIGKELKAKQEELKAKEARKKEVEKKLTYKK